MHVIRTVAALYGLVTFAFTALVLVVFGIAWVVRRVQALQRVPRRGLAPQAWVRDAHGMPQPFRQDYGDGDDVVPEGGAPRRSYAAGDSEVFCMVCGRGAYVPAVAMPMAPCPDCGGERYSNRPDLPILGEPRERAR